MRARVHMVHECLVSMTTVSWPSPLNDPHNLLNVSVCSLFHIETSEPGYEIRWMLLSRACRVAAWKGRCCRFLLVIGNNWNKFRRISVETQADILTVRLSSTATVTVRRRSWYKPSCHIWQWPVEGDDHDPPSDLDTCIVLLSICIQILTVKGPIL